MYCFVLPLISSCLSTYFLLFKMKKPLQLSGLFMIRYIYICIRCMYSANFVLFYLFSFYYYYYYGIFWLSILSLLFFFFFFFAALIELLIWFYYYSKPPFLPLYLYNVYIRFSFFSPLFCCFFFFWREMKNFFFCSIGARILFIYLFIYLNLVGRLSGLRVLQAKILCFGGNPADFT